MPWPLTVHDAEKMSSEKLPEELERLLNLIFSENEQNTEKCERIKAFCLLHLSRCLSHGISRTMETQQARSYCVTLKHLYRS